MPIEVSEEAGVRYLHFGSRWVQGAMRIGRPFALELDYTRDMMLPLLLQERRQGPERALLIGLGAASLTKFLYRHCPATSITVVEIDPGVVAAARQFFKLPDDPARLAIEIGNGNAWIGEREEAFDLVLVDGFDARGSPGALDSTGFYRRCRSRLSGRGLLVTNLLSRTRGVDASVNRLRDAFDDRVLVLPPCESGNTVVVAAAGDAIAIPVIEIEARARHLREATGLNLLPTVAALKHRLKGRGGELRL